VEDRRRQNLILPLTIAAGGIVLCAFVFWPILKTLILAATVAVVVTPYYRWAQKRLWGDDPPQWKQALTAGLVTLTSVLILASFVAIAVILVVKNYDLLRDFAVKASSYVQDVLSRKLSAEFDLTAAVSEKAQQLFGYVGTIFTAATRFFVKFVIFLLSLYFFLRHGPGLVESIRRSFSLEHRGILDRFTKTSYSVLYAIYVVHVATAIVTFVLAVPFFWLIGFSNVFFWSLLCGVVQLIPLLGPSLIMFAIAIYAFATGNTTAGVLCLAVGYPVVAAAPDLVFRPVMMGRHSKLNPLLLLLGFVGGLMSLGAIGFMVGPLALALLAEALKLASEHLRAHNKASGQEEG